MNALPAAETILFSLSSHEDELTSMLMFISFACSPLRALLANYTKNATKGTGRTKWMNSPNVYQKVEVLETGTQDPKKITKVEVIRIEDKQQQKK